MESTPPFAVGAVRGNSLFKKPNFKDAIDVVCYVTLWFVVAMGIGQLLWF
jgi:hypothetical protein